MNPLPKPARHFRSSLQLVRLVNTRVVYSSPSKEETAKKATALDYSHFGYFNPSDYELKYDYSSETKTYSATISPLKVYKLLEDIKLPTPPDERAKIYLEFFSDEFERIKYRAEKMLSISLSERSIFLYATRNLQLARKLFHDTQILFRSHCFNTDKEQDASDIFIIYTLNLFVIRGIVFFSKFFKPYLSGQPAEEEKLREELHFEIPPLYKYPWLFNQRPALYQSLNSFISGSLVNDDSAPYNKTQQDQSASVDSEISNDVQALQQLIGSFKLNCNTNIFADVFYQLMHEKKEEGLPYLEADPAALVKVFSLFFKDKSGQHLNSGTFRSILKPSNYTKRPKKDDKKRIKF